MNPWKQRAITVLGLACLMAVPGCPSKLMPPQPPGGGPPRPMSELLGVVEANARLLDQPLSSNNVSVTANFTDKDRKHHSYNLDGSFLFQSPQNLRLDLRPGLGDQVMQIGSNAEDYWIWIEPEVRGMWWGRYRNVGAPCTRTIAVRPDQLVAALGLGGLPQPGSGLIGPGRKHGEQLDILFYMRDRTPSNADTADDGMVQNDGRFVLEQEYWIESSPPYLIRRVQFRDDLGRTVTIAALDDYRPAWPKGPLVAHKVRIDWPLEEGRFEMSVRSFKTPDPGKVSANAFERPIGSRLPPSIKDTVQVDADCEGSPTQGLSRR